METYDSILKKCHTRIKYYSKFEKTTCFFAIPEFIFGVPLYNVIELRTYMMNSLEKNGFKISEDSYIVFCNWDISPEDWKESLQFDVYVINYKMDYILFPFISRSNYPRQNSGCNNNIS